MRADHLRNVLLVKAIEESDRGGEVIPFADRAAATREAGRPSAKDLGRGDGGTGVSASAGNDGDGASDDTLAPAVLPARARRLLVRRAALVRERLTVRYPILGNVETVAKGAGWISALVLVAAAAAGVGLSALDGTRRIDILAFPLAGLLAWNLFVYLWILAGAFERRARAKGAAGRPWTRAYSAMAMLPLRSLLTRSSQFNAPLAEGLRRFADEWRRVAGPRLAARAARLFHLGAAMVGAGLVAGLYVRGIVWHYQAGWESTFLDAGAVRVVTGVLYGPAAAVTGIPLPDATELAALNWGSGGGERNAARWIHLISATVALFIVLPRLALALLATLAEWRHALGASLPASVVPYFRTVFGETASSVLGRGIAAVVPYAYEPSREAILALQSLLPAVLGEGTAVDVRDAVRYGDEEAFLTRLVERDGGVADNLVLLFTLAATPEDENHGTVIAGVRDALQSRRSAAQLLVMVDEGPYLARLGTDPALAARIEERRRLWRDFVGGHGLTVGIADLRGLGAPAREGVPPGTPAGRAGGFVREGAPGVAGAPVARPELAAELRSALWSAAA